MIQILFTLTMEYKKAYNYPDYSFTSFLKHNFLPQTLDFYGIQADTKLNCYPFLMRILLFSCVSLTLSVIQLWADITIGVLP